MATFTIDLSSPFRSGWEGVQGGPGEGGHQGGWTDKFGMDLKVTEGTEVRAVFSGTMWNRGYYPRDPKQDETKHYGYEVIMVSDCGNLLGYYTHFRGDPLIFGKKYSRGTLLGKTLRDHLHLALATLKGNEQTGVDLYKQFQDLQDKPGGISVTFTDGKPTAIVPF